MPAADQLRPGGLDVGHHHLQAVQRPGAIAVSPLPMQIEQAEPGRGELDEAHLIADRLVDVQAETGLLDVEVPGPVDIADRHRHELEFEVHGQQPSGHP